MTPMELIDQVLAARIKAPSSKNKQPWRFVVVGGKAKEEMLGLSETGLTRRQNGQALSSRNRNAPPDAWNTLKMMKQTPIIIMVLDEESGPPFKAVSSKDRVAEITDTQLIGAATGNTILAAEELGLDTLWICNAFFVCTGLCEWLHINRRLAAAIVLGYPDGAPSPYPRKKSQNAVTYRFE